MPSSRSSTHCRMCLGTSLARFLDMGSTPPADCFRREEQLAQPEASFPLRVVLCEGCGLVQLDTVVAPELLYCNDYPYESSTTRMGRAHWSEFADTVMTLLRPEPGELVVDVGSNAGVLLESFASHGAAVLGVDPAANIVEIANARGVETIAGFFDLDVAERIRAEKGQARIITGTNVFAHIDDLAGVLAAVDALLLPEGAFVIEFPYLVNLIERLEYDTIYHEHLSYLSLKPLKRFLEERGLKIFDVQERVIHGGSVRVFICRREARYPVNEAIEELLAIEERKRIHELDRLERFAADVVQNRDDLRWFLGDLKQRGKRIVAISAPAKGMTLLNYCGLGAETLDYVTEKSTLKIGRYTPGAGLLVRDDEAFLSDAPDYGLLLAWNFAEEIMDNLRAFSAGGGKFVIPIPSLRVVE